MKNNGEIFSETNYNLFKRLEGNRVLSSARAKKIRKSIEINGYIKSPIAVNEHMEIIDGQGRFEALSELTMPIDYYIIPGAGRDQCIAMNIYGTPWTLSDYMESYKETGIESYKYLCELRKSYRSLPVSVVIYAICGKESQNDIIKNGTFSCTREEYMMADRVLEKCENCREAISTIPGNAKYAYMALIFALTHVDIDEQRMFTCLDRNKGAMPRCGNMKEALELLGDIYNHKCRTNRLYLYSEYDKYVRGKYAWYDTKYTNKPYEISDAG